MQITNSFSYFLWSLFSYFKKHVLAQLVKNLPAMRETWTQSLDGEDPLEEGMETPSSILAWRIPMDKVVWWATVHAIAKLDMTE